MAYPPESKIRLPFLELAKDGKTHSTEEAENILADHFQLTTKQRNELKSSGGERLFLHKLRWSRTNLKVAGLITDPKIAHFQITEKGLKILKNNLKTNERIHTRLIISDNKTVLLMTSDLEQNSMQNLVNCGILVTDTSTVGQISDFFNSVWDSSKNIS